MQINPISIYKQYIQKIEERFKWKMLKPAKRLQVLVREQKRKRKAKNRFFPNPELATFSVQNKQVNVLSVYKNTKKIQSFFFFGYSSDKTSSSDGSLIFSDGFTSLAVLLE